MGDQDKVKATNGTGHQEPIWAWEFCPIVVPSMEVLFISHPTFHKLLPIVHHIWPLMPIKIHTIFQFSISPPQSVEPVKCCFDRNGCFGNPFPREDGLDLWACDNLDDILSLQETFSNLHHHLRLDFLSYVFIIKNCPPFPVQLVEGEVARLQEPDGPLLNVSCMVGSLSMCLGYNFCCFS